MQSVIGFVYLWMDSGRHSKSHPNERRFCLGSHKGTEDDGYITGTGGGRFQHAYAKRPQDFRRRILSRIYVGGAAKILVIEQQWLNLIKPEELMNKYYNQTTVAKGWPNDNPKFAAARDEHIRQLNANPEFRAMSDERSRKMMLENHANPEFAKVHSERSSKRFKLLNADPEFAKAHSERHSKRMTLLNANPEFATRRDQNMRRLNNGPKFAAQKSERARNQMVINRNNPEFEVKRIAASTKSIRRLNADPNFQAKRATGLRQYDADPERKAKRIAGLTRRRPKITSPE